MNTKIFMLFALFYSCCQNKNDNIIQTNSIGLQIKINREDSKKWDYNNVRVDMDKFNELNSKKAIFPSPKYDLFGEDSFNGLGYGGNFDGFKFKDKLFVYNYFFVNKNDFNSPYINGLKHDVFFCNYNCNR